MRLIKSPFRYPGGKARLADRIIGLLAGSGWRYPRYVEPFVGGGAIAVKVAQQFPEVELHLNDADLRVAAFWKVMSQRTGHYERMMRRVKETVPSVGLWRDEKTAGFEGSQDDLAFRALFLNRCTFSGNMSLTSGGPIGGFDQSGNWKIDARWKLELLVPNLERLRDLLLDRKVVVEAGEWEVLKDVPGHHYYDPPYMTASAKALYSLAFSVDEHLALRNHLRVCPYPWVLSYDKDPNGHIAWLYEFAAWEDVMHSSRIQKGDPQKRVELLYWSEGS